MSIKPAEVEQSIKNFTSIDINNFDNNYFVKSLKKLIKSRIRPTDDDETPNALLENVEEQYSKNSLDCLLNNLECFSEMMMQAFIDPHMVGGSPDQLKDLKPQDLTVEFALGAVLQQTEIDAMAAAQIIKDREKGQTDTELLSKLQKLDQAANEMIHWAVRRDLFHESPSYFTPTPYRNDIKATREPRPVALVYFSGASKLRMIPYAPIAPLSLPSDLTDKNPKEKNDMEIWLKPALAYEVGRLIFWQGSYQSKLDNVAAWNGRSKFSRFLALQMQAAGYSKWVVNAVSGIFADVFMTMQCDVSAVGHAIRRAQPRKLDRFHGEDLRYQLPPVMRPYVCLTTLDIDSNLNKHISDQNMNHAQVVKDLTEIWTKTQNEVYGRKSANDASVMKPPVTVTVYSDTGPMLIGFDEALSEVKRATKYIVELLNAIVVSSISETSPDSNALTQFGEWQKGKIWMKLVEAYHPTTLDQEHPQAPLDTFFLNVWENTLCLETKNIIDYSHKEESIIDKGTYDSRYSDQRFYWPSILYAGGWTMESLGNNGNPY